MDKVGGDYARKGEIWGLQGRGDFIDFIIYYHAISLISSAKSPGLAVGSSGSQAPAPQLSSLWGFSGVDAVQHFHPAQVAFFNWAWPQPNTCGKLLSAALPTPVTNKISKSFTSIKSVKQDRYLSHHMSNIWSRLSKKLVGIFVQHY